MKGLLAGLAALLLAGCVYDPEYVAQLDDDARVAAAFAGAADAVSASNQPRAVSSPVYVQSAPSTVYVKSATPLNDYLRRY